MEQDNKAIINLIKTSLSEMAFKDIERASNGNSKMGAFILASCFIDYLAGFYAGCESSGTVFKDFVKEFLPSYDKEKLYNDLRCRLVHNYSEGGSFIFTDNEKAGKHLQKTSDGRVIINLENFIEDVRGAMDKYFELIEQPNILKNAIKRYKKLGILTILENVSVLSGSSFTTFSTPATGMSKM